MTGAVLLLLAVGVGLAQETTAAQHAALTAGGCHLCHEVPGADAPAASRIDSCSQCHAWIREVAADPAKRARAMQHFPLWERYERSVASYLEVPSLAAARARLDAGWVEGWLADPHDVRPAMGEGMPRFALDDEERGAIRSWLEAGQFSPPASPPPDAGRVAAGERVFAERGCGACHSFGARAALAAVPGAPDLAHARSRMTPDMLAAWIADPRSVSAEATMPAPGLSAEEVLAVRDFVLLADAAAPAQPAVAEAVATVSRPVAWAEVEERVFGRICVHCHMDPAQNQGRAGPGNAGGFGWAATGIELQTYAGVVAAADRIPAALLRRRAEAARDVVAPGHAPGGVVRDEKPGMPLGLPPLSDDDLALVLGWIEQGMPR